MNKKSVEHFYQLAKEASLNATYKMPSDMIKLRQLNRIKIGAVLVSRGTPISIGWNSNKTSPLQKELNQVRFIEDTPHSLHAEVCCLNKILNKSTRRGAHPNVDWSKTSLFIYRENKNGDPALSKPCPSCMKLIRELHIPTIYYTGNKSYIKEEIQYAQR